MSARRLAIFAPTYRLLQQTSTLLKMADTAHAVPVLYNQRSTLRRRACLCIANIPIQHPASTSPGN
jgi:hypothetical protein